MKEIDQPEQTGSIFSAICLVAGTCIGGGMLALPVATGISGFFPSTLVMLFCWLAMTGSALLLLEVSLWLKKGAHIITMASTFLGPVGKILAWLLYLFISYASLVAYTAAGGSLVMNAIAQLNLGMSKELSDFLFIFLFSGMIYLGNRLVGRVNAILFIAMIVAYVALIGSGVGKIQVGLLSHRYWQTSFLAIPLLLTTFSFQTMLPSLTPYLNRNARSLRWAIIGGTTITFVVYLIWQIVVLGIVPVSGPNSLIEALEVGEPVTQFLREHVQSNYLSTVAEYFAFFALVTSFLGIALGLFDFLSDGLKISNRGLGRIWLSLLIILPTYFFSVYFERIFLIALDTSGGFGDSILNGIMPVLMVWIGRYYLNFPNDYRVPGGKPLLILILAFFVTALVIEILVQTGSICSIFQYCQVYSSLGSATTKSI